MAAARTLAYFNMAKITALESFIVKVTDALYFWSLELAVLLAKRVS
jgi:hypothetical protein